MYALILAGGRGERLRPLTDTIPKPMVQVKGKPILWHQVTWLKEDGITDIVFLCSYRWEAIQEYFRDGADFGLRFHYSLEESPLGRGGAIKQGLGLVPESERTVVTLNGDVLTTQHLAPLLKLHQDYGAGATMMLTPYPSAYGVVEVDTAGKVSAFQEKGHLPHWIHAGVDVLNRDIEKELPELGDHETTTLPRLAEAGQLYAYQSHAYWQSIDSFKDLSNAEEALPEAAHRDTPSG